MRKIHQLFFTVLTVLFGSVAVAQMCSIESCESSTGFSCISKNDNIYSLSTVKQMLTEDQVAQKTVDESNGRYKSYMITGSNPKQVNYETVLGWTASSPIYPQEVTVQKEVLFCSLKSPPQSCKIVDFSNFEATLTSEIKKAYSASSDNAKCWADPMYGHDGQFVGSYGVQCQNSQGHLSHLSSFSLPSHDGEGEECENLPDSPPVPNVPRPDPTNPEDPIDPVDPENPTDPTDPNNPSDPNGNDGGNGGNNGGGCIGNNCGSNNGEGLTKSDITQAIKDADILGCKGKNCEAGDFTSVSGSAGFADVPKTFWESKYDNHDLMKLYEDKVESSGNSIVQQLKMINTDVGEGVCPVIEFPGDFADFQIDCNFLLMIKAAFIFSATLSAFFIIFRR